jgi:hypothetical protein
MHQVKAAAPGGAERAAILSLLTIQIGRPELRSSIRRMSHRSMTTFEEWVNAAIGVAVLYSGIRVFVSAAWFSRAARGAHRWDRRRATTSVREGAALALRAPPRTAKRRPSPLACSTWASLARGRCASDPWPSPHLPKARAAADTGTPIDRHGRSPKGAALGLPWAPGTILPSGRCGRPFCAAARASAVPPAPWVSSPGATYRRPRRALHHVRRREPGA